MDLDELEFGQDPWEMTEEFDKNSKKAKETKEAVETAFAKADTEGTGKLKRDQLEGVLRELSESGHDTAFLLGKKILIRKWFTYIMGCKMNYDDAVSLFIEVADSDGDKLISLNELLMIMNLGDEDLNHKEMLTKLLTVSAKDGNGLITTREIYEMIHNAGLEGETMMDLMSMYHVDNARKLKIEEVVNLFIEGPKRYPSPKEEMKFMFRIFDTNEDGFISKKELAKFFEEMGFFGGEDKPEEVQMMANQFTAEADEDKDGKLNYEEFCNVLEKLEKQMLD